MARKYKISKSARIAQLENQVRRLKRKAARANDAKDHAIDSLRGVGQIANLYAYLHRGGNL